MPGIWKNISVNIWWSLSCQWSNLNVYHSDTESYATFESLLLQFFDFDSPYQWFEAGCRLNIIFVNILLVSIFFVFAKVIHWWNRIRDQKSQRKACLLKKENKKRTKKKNKKKTNKKQIKKKQIKKQKI